MQIQIFGALKKYFDSILLVESESITNGHDLINYLKDLVPESVPVLEITRLAINQELVALDQPIKKDDELALLPPFSGG